MNLENTVRSERNQVTRGHITYDLRETPNTDKSTDIHNRSSAAGDAEESKKKVGSGGSGAWSFFGGGY